MAPIDLTDAEALALICLARAIVAADGVVSTEEDTEVGEIALDLGKERYQTIAAMADAEPKGLDHAMALAGKIERIEAQELMGTMLGDLANSDGISDEERAILNTLKTLWSQS